MQTAVEFIREKLFCDEYWFEKLTFEQIIEQAKEMEKQQIIDAWNGGDYAYFYSKETGRDFADGNEYYNETYGSKGSDEHHENNLEEIISQAHKNITRRKGKEYSPTHVEIQMEIDKIKGNNSEKCRMLEISDEEIEKELVNLLYDFEYEEIKNSALYKFDYEGCAKALTKWYREQLKSK